MNQETLKKYKEQLEKERAMILKEIGQAEKPVDFGSDVDHFEEESNEAEEFGNQLAVANDLRNRLTEIDGALLKIQSGKYGVCEQCGKEIEEEILAIDPESRLCRTCKANAS